jgi:uncharacterized protein YhaN
MRFRRLRARGFGALRERVFELAPELTLLFGPNESGKSTFRAALETVLYGFDPGGREAHPLAHWDGGAGGELELEAELDRDAGGRQRVLREMQARGRLRLAEGDASFEGPRLGNQPLDCVSGIPREVFRSVYSLELAQLAALEPGAQSHVDDLLLPQAAALGLRPVADLLAELRGAHLALWRPTQVGSPEAKRLNEELAQLRREADEAAREEQGMRDSIAEQRRLEQRLAWLGARRAELDRAHEEAPFLRDLFELARRRGNLGDPIDLAPLGEQPLADPAALASEIEELTSALGEPEARLLRPPEALGAQERALLGAASEIGLAQATAVELRSDARQCLERRAAAKDLREQAGEELAGVLARAPGESGLEAVKAIPLEVLRALHAGWVAATERHASAGPPRLPPRALIAVGACFALAAIGFGLSFWLGAALRGVAVGALGIAALIACSAWFAHLRSGAPEAPAELARWFEQLPPARELLARPSELVRWLERIAAARSLLAQARGEIGRAEAGEANLRRQTLHIAELCRRLGLETEGQADQCAARLSAALGQALEKEKRGEHDGAERGLAQARLQALRPGLERAHAHLRRVEAVLRAAEPSAPTLAQAFARVKERLEEAEFLRRREAELRRDPRFEALQHDPRVSPQRDPAGAEWTAEATAAREQERDDCARELAQTSTRLGEIASLLRSDPGGRQARLADRVREGEERLAELRRERDRLALLESILACAERRFRDQHQPPVLLRASAYLERVTRGRWRRVAFEAGAPDGLFVSGGGHDEPVRAASPLSQGTLDQIFLCLRLGLLDHLDEGRERLPLILDDALLRMDDARRPEVYPLLAEVSRQRQVFLLTCQDWIASEAEQRLQVGRISLAP